MANPDRHIIISSQADVSFDPCHDRTTCSKDKSDRDEDDAQNNGGGDATQETPQGPAGGKQQQKTKAKAAKNKISR